MVTYLYWAFCVLLVLGTLYLIGYKLNRWIPAFVVGGTILLVCTLFFFFYLEQIFVKRWGGTMSITVPAGQQHIAATWKQDNLWIENYDPETDTCIFAEYSRGNVLEGRVRIKNCNPIQR